MKAWWNDHACPMIALSRLFSPIMYYLRFSYGSSLLFVLEIFSGSWGCCGFSEIWFDLGHQNSNRPRKTFRVLKNPKQNYTYVKLTKISPLLYLRRRCLWYSWISFFQIWVLLQLPRWLTVLFTFGNWLSEKYWVLTALKVVSSAWADLEQAEITADPLRVSLSLSQRA